MGIRREKLTMQDRGSTVAGQAPCEPLSEEALRELIARSLGSREAPEDIELLERSERKRRRDWRGTRLFEKLTVRGNSGKPLVLFLKHRRSHPDPDLPLVPPDREARVYRDLLQGAPLGAAKFYGSDSGEGSSLLLLEYLEGEKLKKIFEKETWRGVVKWLARLHQHFSTRQDQVQACVPRYDADFYWQWAHRAAETVFAVSARAGSGMERVLSRYDEVAGLLGGAPATLVHGEFYCTNIMVSADPQRLRISAFDWETAALGCGALDLTYLFRQRCGIEEAGLIQAYLEGWREAGGRALSAVDLEAQISAARTHELMCRLWSRMNYRELPPLKIKKYAEKALACLERLGKAS